METLGFLVPSLGGLDFTLAKNIFSPFTTATQSTELSDAAVSQLLTRRCTVW